MARMIQSISLCTVITAAVLGAPQPSRADDPTTADCLGSSESAIALRNEHKLRAARAQLLVCAAANCPADIRNECTRRVTDLNAAIPTIVFEVKDISGKELSAVKVSMDGQSLAERLEGTALSIDPGEHTFTFEAAGQPRVEKQLLIHEGEKERHERIAFGEAATPATTEGTPPRSTSSSQSTSPSLPAAGRTGFGTQRTAALVMGGVGVIGIVVGTVFGLKARSKEKDSEAYCRSDDPSICSQAGLDLLDEGRSASKISSLGLIVGGLALAGGTALYFTAPPSNPPTTGLAGPRGFVVRGTF